MRQEKSSRSWAQLSARLEGNNTWITEKRGMTGQGRWWGTEEKTGTKKTLGGKVWLDRNQWINERGKKQNGEIHRRVKKQDKNRIMQRGVREPRITRKSATSKIKNCRDEMKKKNEQSVNSQRRYKHKPSGQNTWEENQEKSLKWFLETRKSELCGVMNSKWLAETEMDGENQINVKVNDRK